MQRDAGAEDRELIRAYVADELSPDETRATEERLATDEAFFERYWMIAVVERLALARERAMPRILTRWDRVAIVALVPLLAIGVVVNRVQTQSAEHAEIGAGRAVTTDVWFPVRYATGANVGYVELGESAFRLAPESRLTHGRMFSLARGHGWVVIDGHARIETHKADVVVRTSTAEFYLRGNGRYIIDAPVGGAETTVEVVQGSARVERVPALRDGRWRPVMVLPGGKGRVGRDGKFGVAGYRAEAIPGAGANGRRNKRGLAMQVLSTMTSLYGSGHTGAKAKRDTRSSTSGPRKREEDAPIRRDGRADAG